MYTKVAPKGKRIAAYIMDSIILSLLYYFPLVMFGILGYIINLLIMVLYFGLLEGGSKSGTFGKQVMKIVVVDKNGMPLDYSKGFIRAICKCVSYGIVIGPVIGLFAENGRALHDMMAGTFVADGENQQFAAYNHPANNTQPLVGNPQITQPIENSVRQSASIIGVRGSFAGKSFPVSVNGIIMGRDQTACDFVFPDNQMGAGISRVHCKIQYNYQTRMFVLHDLGSSYGTFLGNGIRVVQGQPAALRPGEEFYLADANTTFRTVI